MPRNSRTGDQGDELRQPRLGDPVGQPQQREGQRREGQRVDQQVTQGRVLGVEDLALVDQVVLVDVLDQGAGQRAGYHVPGQRGLHIRQPFPPQRQAHLRHHARRDLTRGRRPPRDEVRFPSVGERDRLVPFHQLGFDVSVEEQHLLRLDRLVEGNWLSGHILLDTDHDRSECRRAVWVRGYREHSSGPNASLSFVRFELGLAAKCRVPR